MTLNCTLFSDLCQCHTLKYAIVHKVKTFLKDYKFRHRFLRVHLYSNWQLILFLLITTRNKCFNSAFQVYNFLLVLKNLASEKFLGELFTGTENSRWQKPSPVCAPNTEVKEGVVCFAYWCIVLRALSWVEQGTGSFKEFMPQKGQDVNVRLYYKPNFWPGFPLFRVFHCDAFRSLLFHWRSILGWNVSEKVPKLILSSRLGVGRWKVCM